MQNLVLPDEFKSQRVNLIKFLQKRQRFVGNFALFSGFVTFCVE